MKDNDKKLSPDRYKLQDGYYEIANSSDKVKASIVYRETNGFKFFDIIVTINDRVFLVKPWSVYSPKTLNVYKWLLNHSALDLLHPQD